MEGKEEDVRLGANRYRERQPIGAAAQVINVEAKLTNVCRQISKDL